VAILLIHTQIGLAVPASAAQAAEEKRPMGSTVARPAVAPKVEVNRRLPQVTSPPALPTFSAAPTDGELFRARVFDEPLVPIGPPTSTAENQALAAAVLSYLARGESEDVGPVVAFLDRHPQSAWRASLLTNLGIVYRRTGYFTRALSSWEEAWDLAKQAQDPRSRATADRAVGELAELSARLGRFERLQALFAELDGRAVSGSAAEKISGAQAGYWLMQNKPEDAFRCGPMAIDRILAYQNPNYRRDPRLIESRSTINGTSLLQMRDFAASLGLRMRIARRGPDADVVVPAMVHWKAGHFAALVREEHKRFLVQDPTFGDELWMTRKAVDDEASGLFLVPEGPLPAGWEAVGDATGAQVWGKGNTSSSDPEHTKKASHKECKQCPTSPPAGMARYSVHSLLVSLNIADVPVGYSPPRGPAVTFEVTYNQRDSFQPQIPSFSNLGPQWTFDWLSYVEDNPSNPSQSVTVYMRGGGRETFSGYDAGTQSYAPHMESRATVARTSSSPIRYERRLPDGSVEVFGQADGAGSFPRRIFMTEWKDPQGNAVTYTFDATLRMVAAQDAIGQVTTLSYEHPTDTLKITKVTDPFGRYSQFDYNAGGQLSRITDVIGIESEFEYGPGDFIRALTTPYGTTRFTFGQAGTQRWIETEDPLGARERVEFRHLAPGIPQTDPASTVPTGVTISNSWLSYRNTFYWDKRAMALHPGDYTKARITHWLHTVDVNVASGVKESEKLPLENRVWYTYPNQTSPGFVGSMGSPEAVARVLDDGATQVYRYEYNSKGKKIKETDPLGRETVYVYGTGSTPDADQANGSGIDLLQVKQKNGGSYDVLASYTYNAQHLPLTSTDAAAKTTTYTYNAQGQLVTTETPPRAGITENRTTIYAYDTNGYLQSVTGPAAGATTSLTYDGYGRVRTATDSEGYVLTQDYDALDRPTKTTYPDTTYEETTYNKLDAEKQRDRLGRWTHTFRDALRRPVATRDPAGRTTTMQWCSCGSMDKLVDANNNATSWERDLQGRVTKEIRADNSTREYTYETTTSRLKNIKDAKAQEIQYSYLLDSRLQQVSYPTAQIATPTVSFTYDAVFPRLATMADGTGATVFGYHSIGTTPPLGAGRLATVDGPYTNDTASYGYDERGRVVNRTLNGVTSSWAYDALGRLSSQGDPIGTFGYAYVGTTGRLQSVTYPNGQLSSYGYLPNSGDQRLQEIHHKTSASGTTLSRFTYVYDAVGNIKTWTQQYGALAANAYDFGYDPADQLTASAYRTTDPTPALLKRYAYAYDPAGNRTTEQVDDSPVASVHNNVNRLTSQDGGGALTFKGTVSEPATVTVQSKPAPVTGGNVFAGSAQVTPGTNTLAVVATDPSGNTRTNTYQVSVATTPKTQSYDANGSLISSATKTYEWDGRNRLLRVLENASEIARFSYDGLGRRAQKIAGGVTRTYVYGGVDIIEERLSAGGTIRYVQGPGIDRPLASVDGAGAVSYYLADHLGSIVQATNNAAGVTLTRQYDPYGALLSGATTSGYAFTGREWDAESNLYYYRARYYDPYIGRFISEDPIGLAAGDTNFYAYTSNMPLIAKDPFGLTVVVSRMPYFIYSRLPRLMRPKPQRGGPIQEPPNQPKPMNPAEQSRYRKFIEDQLRESPYRGKQAAEDQGEFTETLTDPFKPLLRPPPPFGEGGGGDGGFGGPFGSGTCPVSAPRPLPPSDSPCTEEMYKLGMCA
jgi:RHS repeat-associated protein